MKRVQKTATRIRVSAFEMFHLKWRQMGDFNKSGDYEFGEIKNYDFLSFSHELFRIDIIKRQLYIIIYIYFYLIHTSK